MRTIVCLIMALGLSLLTAVAQAGDAVAGKAKARTCFTCHGANGVSNVPLYPNLAGQKEQYLIKALKAYQTGERADPTMKAMAAPLSDTDIENLAAYFAGLNCE